MACASCGPVCNCPGQPGAPTSPGCNPNGYGPGVTPLPGNVPPPVGFYACSLTTRLQAVVDRTRGIETRFGQRPYELWLVWQRRNQQTRRWDLEAEMQLFPVLIKNWKGTLGLDVEAQGLSDTGTIEVAEVSPAQVDGYTLLGYLNGEPWGNDTADREFFYEVRRSQRCATDMANQRLRFVPAGVPFLNALDYGWEFNLVKQNEARTPTGVDQSTPQFSFAKPRGKLVG